MSKAQLKKHLASLDKSQIIEVVMELYEARKEAKDYLEFYLNPNEDAKLESFKKIIGNEFYPSRGEPKTRFSVCRKAVTDFLKLKPSPDKVADLMLFYSEQACQFSYDYGDMWEAFYSAAENHFGRTMKFLAQNHLVEANKRRIQSILKLTEVCGWGFRDTLYDIYAEYGPEEL